MTDLLNPSPPPGGNPSPQGDGGPVAEARMGACADAPMRAGARQDNPDPVNLTEATPAVPEPPGIDWGSTGGGAFVGALCAALTWSGGYEFAQQCGWPAALAWILPLITDIYAGVALWIMLGLRWASKETRHFAAGSTVLAVAASVAMQVIYHILLNSRNHKPAVGVVVAVSVVAPVMLALTAHLMARVNGDRGELIRVAQEAQAQRAEAQRAEAAQVAADHAAADRAAAERAAAAQRAQADRAAADRAEAERAAATQRAEAARVAAERAAADGPPLGHSRAVDHGPGAAGGPHPGGVDHGPADDMDHGPARDVDHGPHPGGDVDHGSDGPDPDDAHGTDEPWTLPAGEPDEQGDRADIYVQARNAFRQSCRDGKPLSDRALAAQFGYSRNWGKTRIAEVKKGMHLARAAGE